MYAFTSSTVYPSFLTIPESHITLLDNFFRLVDATVADPHTSEKFSQLFTSDGVWKTPSAKFEGHEELANSGSTWAYFRTLKWFRHSVNEVFGNDTEGKSVMLMGTIEQETLKGDDTARYPFSARVEFDNSGLMKSFQGWSSGF